MKLQKANPKQDFIQLEHKILNFWKKNKIFVKLQNKNKGNKKWSFLDGPITANNPMGVHHAWGRTLKDMYQRYKAMQGYDQRYQNGFDCQGLWVEVEVEKELNLKTKKDIENLIPNDSFASISMFVDKCKERVNKYSKIQTEQSIRLGQWMNWDDSYFTNSEENNYAIWAFLKKCYDNKWLYKGYDTVPWCPRCGTAISQHEILSEEYKEIVHTSVYVKFPIISKEHQNENLLVWTTTPWTLPANIAIVIDPKKEYVLVEENNQKYWVLEKIVNKIFTSPKILHKVIGLKLIGLKYKSFFQDLPAVKKVFEKNNYQYRTIASDDLILPVSDSEGTGLIHCATGAGAEDRALGIKEKLPAISPLNESGEYLEDYNHYSGKSSKKVSEIVIKDLADNGFLFKKQDYKHQYPTCWRCKEELVFRLVDEWYISMDELRKPMIEITKKINWLPEYGLNREIDWLNNMHDWLISKKRYWGLSLPIFECPKCGNFEVIGSKQELRKRAIEGWDKFQHHSPHRPWIDLIKIKCSKCGSKISRIKDVGNPWLDAGIVPYSTMEYFKNKSDWGKWFPADFICESLPGQFKNWFYSLIAMSTALENKEPFKTVLGYESVRDEKGQEMHKSKGNAIWFDEAAEKIGSDTMRWMYVNSHPYRNLKFGYNNAEKAKREFILILWNIYCFYSTYKNFYNKNNNIKPKKFEELLDKWILIKTNKLIKNVENDFNKFDHYSASQKIKNFVINDLSTWYLRINRKREDSQFYLVLQEVLLNLLKILSPIMPFISEEIFQNIKNKDNKKSIHLEAWPKIQKEKSEDKTIIENIEIVRSFLKAIYSAREKAKIKVRQPLQIAKISKKIDNEYLEILKNQSNIIEITIDENLKENSIWKLGQNDSEKAIINTKISYSLLEEGAVRDIIRYIQSLRKKFKLQPGENVEIEVFANDKIKKILNKYQKEIFEKTFCTKYIFLKSIEEESYIDILDNKLFIKIKKNNV